MVFSGLTSFTFCQNENQNVLLIQHKWKNRVKYMKEGKRVVYWITDDEAKYKGRLDTIKDSSLVIKGQEFKLTDFDKFGGRSTGLKVVKLVGGATLASGTLVSGFGIAFIVEGYNMTDPEDCCGSVILITMGYVMIIVGVPTMAVGSIPLFFTGRRFDLDKWELKISHEIPKKRKDIKR